MVNQNGGGAATNSGIDYQQRVAAFFVLSMGLERDCSNELERNEKTEIYKVSFETTDAIDDIVLTHKTSKTYLQVKRRLSFSEKTNSEFYKTIDQFVRQYNISLNNKDCYSIITSGDSSKKILQDLKKITKSARLSFNGTNENPLSKSEELTYRGVLACIDKSSKINGFNDFTSEEKNDLLKRLYIVNLDVESGGAYEKAFLVSIAPRLLVNPNLVWDIFISKSLDWSKHRQSVDVDGVNSILSKFVRVESIDDKDEYEKDIDSFFKLEFAPEAYDICSGREIVIIDSFMPEFDMVLLELYRFDDKGNFRLKFHDKELEMGDGSKHKLYGRFSTFTGAKRFISEQKWMQDKRIMTIPIRGEHNFDADTIAIAYSEKVRTKFSNTDISKCIHCDNGLSETGLFIEIDEIGLPFDVGIIHQECQRESDRVWGLSQNPIAESHPELKDFDYKKWFACLLYGQALWAGSSNINDPIKHIRWNSKAASNQRGSFCIKVILKDGSYKYMQERGRVQRYTAKKADLVCRQLNEWIRIAEEENNPLCSSAEGNFQGMYDHIQNHTNQPVDMIECSQFQVVKYTRGISSNYDKVKNFYAPLISIVNREEENPLLFRGTLFLVTTPMDLKTYLNNWKNIGFMPTSYRINIVENDEQFDALMSWANGNDIHVLVDPFFNKSGKLLKGSVVQDMECLQKEEASEEISALLFTIENGDGTFTQLFRDFSNDITLLLNENCTSDTCNCMGCQMYTARAQIYGNNLDIRKINKNTIALNLSDSESEWTSEALETMSVDWEDWATKIF